MQPVRLFAVGGVAALVGVVLLVLEVVRTVGSDSLGTAGAVLLWLGLGLFAAGAALIAWAALNEAPAAGAVAVDDSDG